MHPKLYDLDPGEHCPEIVRMIVEIPKHSSNKYEYDNELGLFRLDRTLYSPMHYPGDYGFIPGTLAEDGDPVDVLISADAATFSGCMLEVRPIGVLDMADENGPDQKVLAVPHRNPRYDQVHTIDQIFLMCGGRSNISSRYTKSWKRRRPRSEDGAVPRKHAP